MGRASIISHLGGGRYSISKKWKGKDENAHYKSVDEKITELNLLIAKLQAEYDAMDTQDDLEVFEKRILGLRIASYQKKVEYLQNNFPGDETVSIWCADLSTELSGEVGTIDIPGEWTDDVLIRPAGIESASFDVLRDGDFYPAMAIGPWSSLYCQMLLPGVQKWKPKYRYAWIVDDSIDYENNTCALTIQSAFSSQQSLNVNQGDQLGVELDTEDVGPSGETNLYSFRQEASAAHPGFLDFVERNPDHPISTVGKLNDPIYLTEEQYIQLSRLCSYFDYMYWYENDKSGYKVSDHWDVMYDLGDTWYQIPQFAGQSQIEFTFGNKNLELDETGLAIGTAIGTLEEFITSAEVWNYPSETAALMYAAGQYPFVGPKQKRRGDCEDYVLTKMQAIHESGIIPIANCQVLLCYVINGGYHAVLGIQTANYGFLISDQREYGILYQIENLSRTHMWESFSISTAGEVQWAKAQVLRGSVQIEYMDCNAEAFVDGDEVVVEFNDYDWNDPKVIGFKDNPRFCSGTFIFPAFLQFQYETESRTMKVNYNSETWSWKPAFPRSYDLGKLKYKVAAEEGIAIIAGGVQTDFAGSFSPTYQDVDIFDSVAETFSVENDCPIPVADHIFRSLKNGKCILQGGGFFSGQGQGITPSYGYSTTYQYLISSGVWSLRANGRNVFDHASFVIDGVLYSICGSHLTVFPEKRASSETEAYDYDSDAWFGRQTCPQPAFRKVHGYNIEGKGLLGGGGVIDDFTNEYGGIDTIGETYLYDADTDSWITKADGYSSFGTQATGTANDETVALRFGGGIGGGLLNWYSYNLTSNNWVDKGDWPLTVNDDPVWYSNREYAAGAEL